MSVKQIATIVIIAGLFSCKQKIKNPDDYDFLEDLYHRCDTVFNRSDTLVIVNSKFDTTIIETGIFTYLQYDYPLTTPHKLIDYSKAAVQYDNAGQTTKAKEFYESVIYFYLKERPNQLKEYSDMNGYLQYEVNAAILCSYAYEKLGDNENAIKTLQPFLANVEAWDSKIHQRYIQLCISKYGIEKVRQELNSCGNSIQLKKQDAPEKDDWVVSIFGADIGIGKAWETTHITPAEADTLVKQMDFYKLIL